MLIGSFWDVGQRTWPQQESNNGEFIDNAGGRQILLVSTAVITNLGAIERRHSKPGNGKKPQGANLQVGEGFGPLWKKKISLLRLWRKLTFPFKSSIFNMTRLFLFFFFLLFQWKICPCLAQSKRLLQSPWCRFIISLSWWETMVHRNKQRQRRFWHICHIKDNRCTGPTFPKYMAKAHCQSA